MVERDAGIADIGGHAEPANMFHGATVNGATLGVLDGSLTLIDQEAFDAAPSNLHG